MKLNSINKVYYIGSFIFLLILALLFTYNPIKEPVQTEIQESSWILLNEEESVKNTEDVKGEGIKNGTQEPSEEKNTIEQQTIPTAPSVTVTPTTPSITPPPTDPSPIPEEQPVETNTCSNATMTEYQRLINVYIDLRDSALSYAEQRLNEDLLWCQDDHGYCISLISNAINQFNREHPTCYRSGACIKQRDDLEYDLNRACNNEERSCIANAITDFDNNPTVLNYISEITNFEILLADCK